LEMGFLFYEGIVWGTVMKKVLLEMVMGQSFSFLPM